jgi:hypothetical protein
MRRHAASLAVLVLAACSANSYFYPPPASRLYFPTGMVHVDMAGSDSGVLFIANADFDKRYSTGSVVALNLDQVGLPAFGAPVTGSLPQLTGLGDVQAVQVTPFAGEMTSLELSPGRRRLFVPSRSEGMKFQAVDATWGDGGVTFSCFPPAPEGSPADCATNAPTLTPLAYEQTPSGLPRANSPFGVGLRPRACATSDDCGAGRSCSAGACYTAAGDRYADVFVTHIAQVDSPIGSNTNLHGFLVRVESDVMEVDAGSFIDLGPGATNSVAAGQHWVYASGRIVSAAYPYPYLVREIQQTPVGPLTFSTGLELTFAAEDGRGIALGSQEQRLYVLTRSPDALVVAQLGGVTSDTPSARIVQGIGLPALPNELVVIPRAGQGDLVAITCSGAGVVAIYDEDLGALAAQVTSVGQQPFGITYDLRGAGARLYVSNFADGRVAVIDIPDLRRPQEARLVAHLGEQQVCLTLTTTTAACAGVVAP